MLLLTYVQGICTTGGLAPTIGADEEHLGTITTT